MKPIRQGDVILKPIFSNLVENKNAKLIPHLVLAEGEVTGHRHRICDGQAELYDINGTLYLQVLSDTATLTHEEHKSISIPQGTWIVQIQREYVPMGSEMRTMGSEMRNVSD